MFLNAFLRTFLVVPWLRLHFCCKGLTPGQGTKIAHAMQQKKKKKEMPFSDFLISDGEWSLLPVRREVVWIPGGLLERRECSSLSLNQVPCSLSFVAVWKYDTP